MTDYETLVVTLQQDEILETSGYHVDTAENVDAALVLLESSRVDLVLTDLKMPGRTGLDLLDVMLRVDEPSTFGGPGLHPVLATVLFEARRVRPIIGLIERCEARVAPLTFRYRLPLERSRSHGTA